MATGKRYYWMKLKESFMNSDTIDYFMSLPNGACYVVLYQMLCLKTINSSGRLSRQIGEIIIPFDVEKIRRECKWFSVDTIRVALNLYRQVGLIYEEIDGTLVIADHDSLVGSETDVAARMRSSRASRNNELPAGVTDGEQCAHNVTPDIRDKSIDIRDKSKETRKKEKADAFSEFAGDDLRLLDALRDFEQMRKTLKKPLTDRAKKMLVNRLKQSFHPDDWIPALEKSISHCWLDVYPLKDAGQGSKASGSTGAMGDIQQLHQYFESEAGDDQG